MTLSDEIPTGAEARGAVPPVHRRRTAVRRAWLSLLPALLACGDASPTDEGGDPDAPPAAITVDARPPGTDARAIPVVPDPGTGPLPRAWPDTEPNDTPEQAVRIGMGSGQVGPYIGLFEAADGHLGPGDDVDHFVFRTAPGSQPTFIASACWDPMLNVDLLDFALYRVIDGEPLVPVKATSTADTSCERMVDPFSIPLEPDSKYLFVVTRVAGAGNYEA